MSTDNNLRMDFESAMGEEFGVLVTPPVPFEEASPHECCEAIWLALGDDVSPAQLAALQPEDLQKVADAFGQWFDCESPPVSQIAEGVARTLFRWPPGSIGENI